MYVCSAAYNQRNQVSVIQYITKIVFCADKLTAETHPGMQSNPSSGTCPLARGGFCL